MSKHDQVVLDWPEVIKHEALMKPCPFCTSKGRILPQQDGWWMAGCTQCQARVMVYSKYSWQALAAWNIRDGVQDLSICGEDDMDEDEDGDEDDSTSKS